MQIFNSPFKTTQSWASQGAIILFGTGTENPTDSIPLMVSGLTLTYAQQATPIFPLNTDGNGNATKVNIKGAPQGSLQLQSVYCPVSKNLDEFLRIASRDCVSDTDQMVITIRPFGDIKCASGSDVQNDDLFRLTGVELVSMGLSIQSGEVTLVSMPLNFTFTLLQKEKKS